MSKTDLLEQREREERLGITPDKVTSVFSEHYRLARKTMSAEHAAANAHDAVQRHLASSAAKETLELSPTGGGEAMP